MKFIPAIFFVSVAFAQTDQFEVASIRPSVGTRADHIDVGVHIDGQELRCTFLSVKDYIMAAYKLKNYQVTGPDWMNERYDISAKLPVGATMSEVPDMLKQLLKDRFKMKYHMEKKDFPVYALVVEKSGLKAKESPDDGAATEESTAPVNISGGGGRGGVHIDLGHGSYFTLADNKFIARKITMPSLADTLARFEDKPVIDMTGVSGAYDIDLSFTEEDYRALLIRSAIAAGVTMPPEAIHVMEAANGYSMVDALDKLGLKLESRKAPIDMMIVDQLAKGPTEN